MLGRLVTSYFVWGHLADTFGRVWALQVALVGSAVCSILLGTSTTLLMAFISRTLLGACNGIMSNTKTLASEVHGKHHVGGIWELRTMGLVIGMRSWGLLIGPVAGGLLAEPLQQYASWTEDLKKRDHWAFHLLSLYPFLLPNLLGAVLCTSAAIALGLLVRETLPSPKSPWKYLRTSISKVLCACRSMASSKASEAESGNVPSEESMLLPVHTSHGLPDDSAAADDQSSSVWQSKLTRQHMVLIWTFGMVASFIDEALPLYCMMFLAMGEVEIGQVLSIAGIFFASLQYLVFSTITQRLGSQRAIWMGAMFGSLPTVFLHLLELGTTENCGLPQY